MKEEKVYMSKLPKSCVGCKYFAEHRRQCNLELCLQWNEVKFKFDDCPLIDIKTHDRELVKEVCEKIKERAVNMYYAEDQEDDSIEQAIVISRNEAVDEFIDILDQIQKEYEK